MPYHVTKLHSVHLVSKKKTKKKTLHIFSSFYFEGHGYLNGYLHCYRIETVHIARNENCSLDKIPFSKPLTKREKKKKGSCMLSPTEKGLLPKDNSDTHFTVDISLLSQASFLV